MSGVLKVLVVSVPGAGHLNPMTTLARELQSRNHDVVFISLPDGEPSVRAAGSSACAANRAACGGAQFRALDVKLR